MKKLTIVLIFICGLFSQELASFENYLGARPFGMGRAFTAVSNDANAVLWNAAAMQEGDEINGIINYMKLYGVIPEFNIVGKYSWRKDLAFGGFIKNSGDNLYSETEINVAASYDLKSILHSDQFYVGFNLYYRSNQWGNDHEGIHYSHGSGAGVGSDLSLFYRLNKKMSMGLKYSGIFNSFTWDNKIEDIDDSSSSTTEETPSELKFGIGYQTAKYQNFAIDYRTSLVSDTPDRLFIGAEYSFFDLFTPRFGFSQNLFTDINNINQEYSIGLGVITKYINIQFAYVVAHIEHYQIYGIELNL